MEVYLNVGILLSQQKYSWDVLNKFKMEQCKPIATPLVQNVKFIGDDGQAKVDASVYRSMIGSLLYLTATRPDLTFPASLLSRFVHSPTLNDLAAVKSVFRYLKRYYCSWYMKQDCVAQSTSEAEYIAATGAANQAIWLRKLMSDLGEKQMDATVTKIDNKSAIAIAQNPVQHGRTKHINVKYHSPRPFDLPAWVTDPDEPDMDIVSS
ncbi:hypothetical protein GH714_007869 [Hevea brasiliensis]|uniref:Reverse transcriptase Ty1/copia-type domain-containing protein n=1 Tax=Hevea brasiliensis TaxID=3981 RepID=A0A6A6MCX8_HEVBR|nr:hypothetical protein GH714_007869 [Hevea brasiliensis]